MEEVGFSANSFTRSTTAGEKFSPLSLEQAQKASFFLQSFPQYCPTPLVSLPRLAEKLGLRSILIKDESKRFNLNAFKVLGSAYALGRILAEKLSLDSDKINLEALKQAMEKQGLPIITFTTATDGNHGRGLAWAANYLGHKAIIYMPAGSSAARVKNIAATGAKVIVTDLNYDQTVDLARREALKHGRMLVQDTVSKDHDQIPLWIMTGYMVMAVEAMDQLIDFGLTMPSHLLLQCGVGSFPASILSFFNELKGSAKPCTAIVEPSRADPFFESAKAGDGTIRTVDGSLDTIMAGLACGVPNPLAWEIAHQHCHFFFSCPDYIAAYGMRILANPLPGDPGLVSGESGAVTCGLLSALCLQEKFHVLRQKMGLGKDSVVLLFNTEGDTDPQMYRKILWDGAFPLPE